MYSKHPPFVIVLLLAISTGCYDRSKQGTTGVSKKPDPAIAVTQDSEKEKEPATAGDEQTVAEKDAPSESDVSQPVVDQKVTSDTSDIAVPATESKSTPRSFSRGVLLKKENIPSVEDLIAQSKKEEFSWDRFAIVLEGGPVLVDVTTHIDGVSIDMEMESVRSNIIPNFFADLEVPLQWEKVLEHRSSKYGTFGNLKSEEEKQINSIIRKYDKNQDLVADPRELHAFLTRGLSERSLILVDEANMFQETNRDRSPVFQLLDANRNGILETEEVEQAPRKLMQRDRNGDYVLTERELDAIDSNNEDYMNQRQGSLSKRWMPIVNSVGRSNDKEIAELFALYRTGNGIEIDRWLEQGPRFAELDGDHNESLSKKELARVTTLSSDFLIDNCWERVVKQDEENQVSSELRRSPSFFESNGLRLRFERRDPLSSASIAARIERYAEALGVSREKDSAIVETPPGSELGSPKGMDVNGDDRLSWGEIEVGIRMKAALTSGLIRVRLVDVPDAWFTWLDSNWDKVLSEAEIQHADSRLKKLRTDSDSEFAPESLPVQLEVIFSRLFGDEDPFRAPGPGAYREMPSNEMADHALSPEWLQAMDTNGDGQVVYREFLGSQSSFRSLDRNGDDVLDLEDFR